MLPCMDITAADERARIVAHVREAAARMLWASIKDPVQYDLCIVDRAVTVMEEVADMIEVGDHWRKFD